jgi:hypothetical protein
MLTTPNVIRVVRKRLNHGEHKVRREKIKLYGLCGLGGQIKFGTSNTR